MGRAALKEGFSAGTSDYKVQADDYIATIRAKDFPNAGEHGEFRVYAIYGDITRPDDLQTAIGNLLTERGIQKRTIIINY